MHVADTLMMQCGMMHCGMGSVSFTARRVAFDIWPRVVAWRWQSDAASLEFPRSRLGVAFLVDIHRTSVNRWELRFAAACMASRKAWYGDAQEKLQTKRIEPH